MQAKHWITAGGLLGGLGVMAGALGAHGLKDVLSAEQMPTYEIAVRYQMYHALALVLVGLLAQRENLRSLQVAGWGFLTGVLIFSGLLYAMVFAGVKILGAIVPLGGAALIVGWLALACAGWRLRR